MKRLLASTDEPGYSCSVCARSYKRREHLQRHAASHNPARPHKCVWCNSAYQRADVLRRHSLSCQLKASTTGGLPGTARRRRRACDYCVRQKKACSTGLPCENCRRKCLQCHYSMDSLARPGSLGVPEEDAIAGSEEAAADNASSFFGPALLPAEPSLAASPGAVDSGAHLDAYMPVYDLIGTSTANNTNWLDFFHLPAEHVSSALPAPALESYRFSFLDSVTRLSGLANSFDCCSVRQREAVVAWFRQSEAARPYSSESVLDRHPDSQMASASEPTSQPMPMLSIAPPPLASPLAPPWAPPWAPPQDPLIIKTHQILHTLREVVVSKPRNSCVTAEWSPMLEKECFAFFSPYNLRKFLALYWDIWHPNVNIVHRPSFSPVCAKSILIAGMALIGASISPDPTDNEQAKPWFNCVEEMVFADDDFCSDPIYTCDPPVLNPLANIRKIQALQAGYIVCLYQNWEGSDASKRRIRRYRFSTLVSVARDIGLAAAKHRDYGLSSTRYDFDWKDFIAREQLIRTFIWIYLLDHAFVIFNNLPPRMVIREMDMDMAWPESVFQAATSAECAHEVCTWLQRPCRTPAVTIHKAIEHFCTEALAPDMQQNYAAMGPLNLFVIVSAFHTSLFQQQSSSFCGIDQLHPIRTALHNWKLVWEVYSAQFSSTPPHEMTGKVMPMPGHMWRRTGFLRHSPEYWLLANLLVNRISRNMASQPDVQHDTEASGAQRNPTILSKYDQTSMRQVNELIMEFEHVRIA